MNIESVRIENFRCFKDETIIFDNYTCLVGSNGSGKSTILSALNIFFENSKDSKIDSTTLTADDFHHKNTAEPIKITVTFTDLSDEAKEILSHYVRNDKLIVFIKAEYDPLKEKAEVFQHGSRLGIGNFAEFFNLEKDGKTVKELRDIFKKIRDIYPDLPNVSTKGDMLDSLHEYEAINQDKCTPLPSKDQFYGINGKGILAPFIQWVCIPATKDATIESEERKDTALGLLLARTVRSKINFTERIEQLTIETKEKYKSMLESQQTALSDISKSLQERLQYWAHPDINTEILWNQDSEKAIQIQNPLAYAKFKERGFEGILARFGHGLQRSYILALLQALNESNDKTAPTLIMAIEEPEIYQHPPQSKYLSEILYDLSETNSQIVICSHSPYFIPRDDFEKVRIVRAKGSPSNTSVSRLEYKDLAEIIKASGHEKYLKEAGILAKLYPSLNPSVSEMFFCNVPILVEGIEDVAYINTYMMLTGKMGEFRKLGCHVVPVEGKGRIIKPLAVANLLKIPVFTVFDGDTQETDEDKKNKHKKDNKAILCLSGHKEECEWPAGNICESNMVMWKTEINQVVESEIGSKWDEYQNRACAKYSNPGGLQKNPLAIACMLEEAWKDGNKSSSLLKLIDDIVSFAENS